MNGGKQSERGQDVDEGSGHGRQSGSRHTQPAEQALQANTAGGSPPGSGLKTNGPQLAGFAAKTTAADVGGLSPCR